MPANTSALLDHLLRLLTGCLAAFPAVFSIRVRAGRERSTLPMLYARFAQWDALLSLDPAELDYSNDGVMIPPATAQFTDTVYHYVQALAHAGKAAHAQDGE